MVSLEPQSRRNPYGRVQEGNNCKTAVGVFQEWKKVEQREAEIRGLTGQVRNSVFLEEVDHRKPRGL